MKWQALALIFLTLNLLLGLAWLSTGSPPEPERPPLPALDPALPQLELVNEIAQAEQDPGAELCYTIGPLATLLSQQRAEDRLRPFASLIRTRQTSADSDRGW